jgi:hypothetical protein
MWTIEDLATDKINLSATFYCSFTKFTKSARNTRFRDCVSSGLWIYAHFADHGEKKAFCCFWQLFHNDKK